MTLPMIITPKLKDDLLSNLLDRDLRKGLIPEKECLSFGIDPCMYVSILEQFEDMNFLSLSKTKSCIFIDVKVDMHDFFRRGGFVAQEELLKANIEKLGYEIDLLCKHLSAPEFLDKAKTISIIGSNILSSLAFFR
ncbi:hypothetical protein KML24004_19560 [Alistipes indistinctus]|jgi:hypothetical protein